MSVKIFVMTHKKFDPPQDALYIPLHVGRRRAEDLGYAGDDAGDSISEDNPYFSELTGVYWVWKNVSDADIVGICHYRRYLINEKGELFGEREITELLKEYDMITTKLLTLKFPYMTAFGENHNAEDLAATGQVIQELYPDYYESYERIVHDVHTYFGNMVIMQKPLFDEYCAWLFSILFEVKNRINTENYDNYQKRVFGFISEILLYVWSDVKGLRVKECMVGMSGEKAETREIKNELSGYFARRDVQGAKNCFLEHYRRRPDILMEASDVLGELKLSMQVISTCEFELTQGAGCVLDRVTDFGQLMTYFGKVNAVLERCRGGRIAGEDREYLKEMHTSEAMIRIAAAVVCTDEQEARFAAEQLL